MIKPIQDLMNLKIYYHILVYLFSPSIERAPHLQIIIPIDGFSLFILICLSNTVN